MRDWVGSWQILLFPPLVQHCSLADLGVLPVAAGRCMGRKRPSCIHVSWRPCALTEIADECSTSVCNYPGSAQEQQEGNNMQSRCIEGPDAGVWTVEGKGMASVALRFRGLRQARKARKEMEGTRLLATFVSLHHWHGGKPQFSGNGGVAEDEVRFGCQMAEGDHYSHPRTISKH